MHVVVSDRFGFSPDFLAAIGDDALAILRAASIDATWSPEEQVHAEAGDHQWQVNGAGSFLVLFSGKAPSAWGVKRRAMGIVVAEPHPRRHVIVFPLRVLRVLNVNQQAGRPPAARYNRPTARAFARVVVHELVHAIVPGHSHSERGLMRGTLNRQVLLRQELPIDPGYHVAIATALQSLHAAGS